MYFSKCIGFISPVGFFNKTVALGLTIWGGKIADFWVCLFVAENWCKQNVWQPLRRLTPPAPLAQWSLRVIDFWGYCFVAKTGSKIYKPTIFNKISSLWEAVKNPQNNPKLALPVQGRVVWAFSEHREGCSTFRCKTIIILNQTNCKALFGKESLAICLV